MIDFYHTELVSLSYQNTLYLSNCSHAGHRRHVVNEILKGMGRFKFRGLGAEKHKDSSER